MSDGGEEILADHRWRRTTLVPPFIDSLGETLELVRWDREMMPDFLWIGLLYTELGGRRTVEILKICAEESQQYTAENDCILASDFDELSESNREQLRDALPEDVVADLTNGLEPLVANYPSCPHVQLCDEISEPEDYHIGYLADITNELSDRYSDLSTHVQGLYIGTLMATGNITIPRDSELAEINQVFDYPDTEESRIVGSVVRASTKAMQAASESDGQSDWARRFWQRGFELTECIFPQELEDDPEDADEKYPEDQFFEEIFQIGVAYEEDLRTSLLDLWWDAEFDSEFTGKNEVLDGLLFRQANLATSIATSPGMWSIDVGSIILRCMADLHITLEWFNQEGTREDYQAFIDHGLGQEKLFLEHSSNYLSNYSTEEAKQVKQGIDGLKDRLEGQRYRHLIPVDVGHWANKTTRTLAEEARCKDIYNTRFNQHSPSVHAQWNAIEKQNLVTCMNPLHQYHKIPEFRPVQKVPFTVVEAGNLMNRSLDSWIEARGLSSSEFEVMDLAGTIKAFLKS